MEGYLFMIKVSPSYFT